MFTFGAKEIATQLYRQHFSSSSKNFERNGSNLRLDYYVFITRNTLIVCSWKNVDGSFFALLIFTYTDKISYF